MKLILQSELLAIIQWPISSEIPNWVSNSKFYSITRTHDELSLVVEQNLTTDNMKSSKGWVAFKVDGVLDFSLTGILYQLSKPLAEAKISIFAISTFNTDYILIKQENAEQASQLWSDDGHEVENN